MATIEKQCVNTEPTAVADDSVGSLETLRRLIVNADEVGEVLPDALRGRAADRRITEAALPLVEKSIQTSAARNPQILTDAILPIIGPVIRKAIAEALSSMVQALNKTLEHSLSPRGIKWRLEALRTGKTFGEVALLKTLLFRVEQVFLIHKETGLLLQHVTVDPKLSEDVEMVSSMLTAIQDFAHDSFHASQNATLDELKLNEFAIWIEHGARVTLAAVIRGEAPVSLRENLENAVESIEFQFDDEIRGFNGENAIFEKSRPLLGDCLRFQTDTADEKGGLLSPLNLIGAALLIGLLILGFFQIRDMTRWSRLTSALRAETGLILTQTDRGWFKHSISGLRDENAVDPAKLAADAGYDANDVEISFRPFIDVSRDSILRRIHQKLFVPEDVQIDVKDGAVTARGKITDAWHGKAYEVIMVIPGVKSFEVVK